jgi:hypothetical protein
MASPLIYPEELRSAKRPMMEMKCIKPNDGGNFVVYVPVPTGIQFQDGASYNDADLGIKGGMALSLARNLKGSGSATEALKGVGKTATDLYNSATTKDIMAVALKGVGDVLGDDVRSGAQIGMGTMLNKNVTTEFTGVGVRSFTFQFKFVAKTQIETRTIGDIIRGFRSNLYPIGNFISLKYPPTWTIRFVDGENGEDLIHLPKIFECYLTDLTSNFNPTINVWRDDYSPIETDVTVAFKESRALTYEDINSLNEKAYAQGDFLRQYGGSEGAEKIINDATGDSTEPPSAPVDRGPSGPINVSTTSQGNFIPTGGFGVIPRR